MLKQWLDQRGNTITEVTIPQFCRFPVAFYGTLYMQGWSQINRQQTTLNLKKRFDKQMSLLSCLLGGTLSVTHLPRFISLTLLIFWDPHPNYGCVFRIRFWYIWAKTLWPVLCTSLTMMSLVCSLNDPSCSLNAPAYPHPSFSIL